MTQRTLLSRFRVWAGLAVLGGVATLAVPTDAANPHLVSSNPTMNDPVFVSPGNVAWDAGLTVPFKIAGLGNNAGLTVTLNTFLTTRVSVGATTTLNSIVATMGFTVPSGLSLSVSASAGPPAGNAAATINASSTTPTLSSGKNGNVSGTLSIRGVINMSIPDNFACVQVSYTQTTLTFLGQTVAIPDVSREFDTTGSFCSDPTV